MKIKSRFIFSVGLSCILLSKLSAQNNAISTTGYVGIGTLTPANRFVVQMPSATGYNTSGIWFRGANNTDGMSIGGLDNSYKTINTYGGALHLNTVSENGVSIGGNFGIGTTTPVNKFVVQMPSATGYNTAGVWLRGSGDTDGMAIGGLDNSQKTIDTYGGNLYLNSVSGNGLIIGGNVGIGTSSPSEKFSVNGNAYVHGNIAANGFVTTKKLTVTQTGWSDYVFNEDYKLRNLFSLEAFIKQYKHLPDIPSAKEVEENGISVGDNQALLLKKIEELTLYVIQLQKQLNVQAKEICKMKKQGL